MIIGNSELKSRASKQFVFHKY